jgi:lipopolysaccharide export system permease protein
LPGCQQKDWFLGCILIVFRYLIGEVFKSQLAVFLILITIILSQRFVKTLADASDGELPGQLVFTLVALKLPQMAILILPLAAFLGVLIAYGRIYAESEMTVLHATGVSEWLVGRITLVLSLVIALLAAGLTLHLSPWAAEREYQLLEKVSSDSGLSTLIPGRFQQTSNDKAVVFVQDISRDGHSLSKVFLAQQATEDGGQHSVVYAQTGTVLEDSSGAQRLVLSNGRRYAGAVDVPEYDVLEFGRYDLQIREQQVEQRRRKLKSLPTLELYQQRANPEAVAELHWRLAIPLSIPILMLLAVPLSKVNPRQGKFGRLLPALSLFLTYYILLIVSTNLIEDGKLPQSVGLWWIHALVLGLAAILLLQSRAGAQRLKARIFGRGDHA